MKRINQNPLVARAFTLIELLVVIAIIAVLVALIFPAMSSVSGKANQMKCVNQLKQWAIAIAGFSNDHEGLVLCGSKWNSVGSGTAGVDTKFYEQYLNTGGSKSYTRPGTKTLIQATEYFRACPAQKWDTTSPTGYGFARPQEPDDTGKYTGLTTSLDGTGDSNLMVYNIRRVASPTQLLQLMETEDPSAPGQAKSLTSAADIPKYVKPICTQSSLLRHGGPVNALFADGHVASFQWSDIDQDSDAEKAMVTKWFQL